MITTDGDRAPGLLELFQHAVELEPGERERLIADLRTRWPARARELSALLAADGAFAEGTDAEPAPDPDALRPGGRIGPFRVVRLLAEGGMGTVYLARQQEPVARDVALKLVRPGWLGSSSLARFRLEQETLARMDHPGIARVYAAGETAAGQAFLAMEYVSGEPITAHCATRHVSLPRRLELFAAVCDAVQHAHQKGVLHRDLKPSNVLVTRCDGRWVPKVIDFGVAKPLSLAGAARRDLTRTGGLIGTPEYMSPEQAGAIAESVDTRSDVWSLGVLLYQLLTDELPHERDGEHGLAALFDGRPVPPPSQRARCRALRGNLDWVTLQALEREPARRYSSGSQLAEDVRRHLRGEPVLAGAPGALYRLRKWIRRNRWTAALLLLLVTTAVGWTVHVARQEHSLRRANAELLRLSDGLLVEELVAEARDELWPAHPDLRERLESWLARADELLTRADVHREALRAMGERASEARAGGARESLEARWRREVLTALVAGLDDLGGSAGVRADVAFRLTFARDLPRLSLEEHAEAWELARAAVAADPAFEGFDLVPQLGLVPLGPDPTSGLQEFAHLATGRVPERDAAGELVLAPDTGLVLVLLPGGPFRYGDLRAPGERKEHEVPPTPAEMPWREIVLAPFLVSKHEMTQAQWLRATGRDPSLFPRNARLYVDPAHLPPSDPLLHPVESVTHVECVEALARIGLDLPTGIQWEFAARGGTTTLYWWGDGQEPIETSENLGDLSAAAVAIFRARGAGGRDDGWPLHAPVGTFAPNPFGLYDVSGNVREWCKGDFQPFTGPVRDGDGLRTSPEPIPGVESRGSAFERNVAYARCSRRMYDDRNAASRDLGVRPVCPLR